MLHCQWLYGSVIYMNCELPIKVNRFLQLYSIPWGFVYNNIVSTILSIVKVFDPLWFVSKCTQLLFFIYHPLMCTCTIHTHLYEWLLPISYIFACCLVYCSMNLQRTREWPPHECTQNRLWMLYIDSFVNVNDDAHLHNWIVEDEKTGLYWFLLYAAHMAMHHANNTHCVIMK